jgi:preprotein translocase subunit YajC
LSDARAAPASFEDEEKPVFRIRPLFSMIRPGEIMTIRKTFLATSISVGLMAAAASPAFAQSLSVGATVTDPQGGEVGTITSVDGDAVILRTDRHEVRLPAASFTATDEGVLFGMTREQVNTQVDQMTAQAEALMAVGSMVRDREGAAIGPIAELDEQFVTITYAESQLRLPREAVAATPNGPIASVTVAEIEAQTNGGAE